MDFNESLRQFVENRWAAMAGALLFLVHPMQAEVVAFVTELRGLLGDHPAGWMLWEGEPLSETAAELRALGVEPIVFDQCGKAPPDGDYLSVMAENVERLRGAYR